MENTFRLVSNKSYVMVHHAVNTLSENGIKHLPFIILLVNFFFGVHKLQFLNYDLTRN